MAPRSKAKANGASPAKAAARTRSAGRSTAASSGGSAPAKPARGARREQAKTAQAEADHADDADDYGGVDEDDDGEELEVEAALGSDDALADSSDERVGGAKGKRASTGGEKAARKKRRRTLDQNKAYKYPHDGDDDDESSLDSDALDEDDDVGAPRKRKRVSEKATPKKPTPKKKQKQKQKQREESEEEDPEFDLKDGQEVVGVVVQAPKTGRVPPGQISKNTLNFLSELKKPECNDREWFKLHEPVYRLAEKEWKDFIDEFTPLLVEADPEIPHLPAKDVIHRIYRDIRFSNDKTPYKTGFSASFSRSGRKGIFAVFKPGGESIIAAGAWQPGKNELATIRSNILRSPRRLREIMSAPAFVRYFGAPMPNAKDGRTGIFGREDELKNAPKGVAKDHPDIDLLKCRSFAVVHRFLDSEVLARDFKNALYEVVEVVKPFVHCLNDMMTMQGDSSDEDNEDGDEGSDEE
ncbi:hypothetical protein C8Q72DRAFT_852371 [Fomitopsis betulina]|nr:hypothetical protein C8Q72DRAFT_852371 [Fomitopsis betulina]